MYYQNPMIIFLSHSHLNTAILFLTLVTLEYLLESYIFFEVLYIMAQMWYYIKNFSYKQTKVTSDFISNYLKKVIGGATTQKNLKTNTKIFYIDLRYVS